MAAQHPFYDGDRPNELLLRRCKLVVNRDDGSTIEWLFDQPSITIGASDDNDLVIGEDETVSRQHCVLYPREQSQYLVADNDSTNGTWINDVRIRTGFLKPGCTLTVGRTKMRFHSIQEKVAITPSHETKFGHIVGGSQRMREIFAMLKKIAPTDATIVIEGETGTGKEVVARTIHEHSRRANGALNVFDCSAVPAALIESELFGHEKGAFTGAIAARPGVFESADGGTVFLDELGELELDLQPKLLRALEQRTIRRVGSNKVVPIDVRLIAATNRNLQEEVKEKRFREDLFYRLSVVRFVLPPLRERLDDLPLLVQHFLNVGSFNQDENGRPRVRSISDAAIEAMKQYAWPGNVRELHNVVERACAYAAAEYIQIDDLPDHLSGRRLVRRRPKPEVTTVAQRLDAELAPTFKEAKSKYLSDFEKQYVETLLTRNSWNISHAAREASIDRKYLRKLMAKHEIVPPNQREEADAEDAAE